jgi:integrase
MLNPNYLIKSRHDIYYFRYPLPVKVSGNDCRISISLKTRCPKEALLLAKALEYHSVNLLKEMSLSSMKHAEIMSIFKRYYAEILEKSKSRIDVQGQIPMDNITNIQKQLKEIDEIIEGNCDDIYELLGVEASQDHPIHQDLQAIIDKYQLDVSYDSSEYVMMKGGYKYARRNHYRDLLSYNDRVMDYTLLGESRVVHSQDIEHDKPDIKLGKAIGDYLNEIKVGLSDRSLDEQRDCLKYLIDFLGDDYLISKMNNTQVQEIKTLLIGTPKNRNKSRNTKGHALLDQISIAKEKNIQMLGSTSVNKYLAYFGSLFGWACQNNYIPDNPFKGIRIKAQKKKHSRRDHFNKAEIGGIITKLGDGEKNNLVKHSTYYWGALIAIYTGARRNEIASLLPDDIKKDDTSGIWYFDITDEGESKQIKTDAAKRIVPIHSKLIELGFLEYVEEARKVIKERPKVNGYRTRLLYDLTYTDHEKWGRKLGRWFNEEYLVCLGLKTEKKSLHSIRHSFITHLSAAGVESSHIKALVGHEANTVTDQTYTHFDIEHLPVFKDAIEMLMLN